MQHRRWYDKSPTLSMAISLLHNASDCDQSLAIHFMRQWMNHKQLLDQAQQAIDSEQSGFFFFRLGRKEDSSSKLTGTIELLKHIPVEQQEDLATLIIQYMYTLELGLSEPEFPDAYGSEQIVCYQ